MSEFTDIQKEKIVSAKLSKLEILCQAQQMHQSIDLDSNINKKLHFSSEQSRAASNY